MSVWSWLDSDWAEWLLLPGLACAALALWAWAGDRRRMRRSDPDAVGFMPWTTVFFFSFSAACLLLGLAARSRFGA